MHDKERQIKDLRTMEAMQKNLMGPSGKFGVILKHLGEKIRTHGSAFYGETSFTDPWTMEEERSDDYDASHIYDLEDYGEPVVIGWYFDGLSRGMHIEIRYLESDRDLTVQYQGYLVYREIGGQLDCYVPRPEWEDKIDRLYEAAHRKAIAAGKMKAEANKTMARNRALGFLEKLRLRWGI